MVIRGDEEKHLFSVKPNVMLAYTSKRESAGKETCAVIRHVHATASHTLCT